MPVMGLLTKTSSKNQRLLLLSHDVAPVSEKMIFGKAYAPGETPPPPQRAPFLEEVDSPVSPCARGSVRYDARFHRFSYSSSNFSMAIALLC